MTKPQPRRPKHAPNASGGQFAAKPKPAIDNGDASVTLHNDLPSEHRVEPSERTQRLHDKHLADTRETEALVLIKAITPISDPPRNLRVQPHAT